MYNLTKKAAQDVFGKPKTRGKRDNCDPRLRTVLNYRRPKVEGNDSHTAKQLTRQIKKLARKTKLNIFLAGLKDNRWGPVKPQRNGYTPRHTKLKNRQGQQVHDRMRAEIFADCYEHEHWAGDQEERP